MICQQCKCEFTPKRHTRFCSYVCHHQSMRTVDYAELRALVVQGIGKSEIARRLGANRITVRKRIAVDGLEGLWRKYRYHKGGVASVTGASAPMMANTPSARCS
jgi:hypothetical protein